MKKTGQSSSVYAQTYHGYLEHFSNIPAVKSEHHPVRVPTHWWPCPVHQILLWYTHDTNTAKMLTDTSPLIKITFLFCQRDAVGTYVRAFVDAELLQCTFGNLCSADQHWNQENLLKTDWNQCRENKSCKGFVIWCCDVCRIKFEVLQINSPLSHYFLREKKTKQKTVTTRSVLYLLA